MKAIPKIEKTYSLNEESIDLISEDLASYCQAFFSQQNEITRRRLALEECLLTWMTAGFEGYTITLSAKRKLLKYGFTLSIDATAPDPFSHTDENLGDFSAKVMSSLGLAPEYYQEHGSTKLSFTFKRQTNPILQLCTVIAASVIVSYLGLTFIPSDALQAVMDGFIVPIYGKFFDILRCIAGPMVFLSVAWGVYGIGDTTTLGHIGKRMFLTYLRVIFLGALFGLVSFPVLGGTFGSTSDLENTQFSSIFNLLLGIVPADIFSPFISGNTLQIIFLALVAGCCLLFIGKKVALIADIISQINLIVMFCMEAVSKLVPFFVFLIILNLSWSGSLNMLLPMWKLLVTIVVLFVIVVIVFIVLTSIRMGKSPVTIAKYGLPSFLIAFTTASSSAAFGEAVSNCNKNFRVSSKLTSFAVPLGIVVHNPFAALKNVSCILFFATTFDMEISLPWLVTGIIVCVIVTIATPPVPGGAVAAYTMMFAQMGIPAEGLAMVIALDVIIDFIVTACEMYCLPMTIWNIAKHLNLVDEKSAKQ